MVEQALLDSTTIEQQWWRLARYRLFPLFGFYRF
jgi:hypothetical protein